MKSALDCDAQRALAKARLLYGTTPRYTPATPAPTRNVQSESQLIAATLAACPTYVRQQPTTESARMRRLLQQTQDAEIDPMNSDIRFKEFVRFFPEPSPPVSGAERNASMPKTSTACQLPNSQLFPIFPA
jgi:hypothetical protein